MKRWILFAATLGLLASALVLSQARKVEAPFTADALHYFVADGQRELTRLPMKYTRISDSEEIAIGNQIASQLNQATEDEETRTVEAYLRSVGDRMAMKAHRRLPYKFHYIPERYFVNAFAIPGGHVYVGAGLIGLMKNEDELASVLGHEIEHIDHYHCIERVQLEAAMRHIPLAYVFVIPLEVFQAGYNKDQELEADREGTHLAVAAGYSPQGAVDVFTQFKKLEEKYGEKRKRAASPEEEAEGTMGQILTGYFRSHPPSADRIAAIQKLIAEENWKVGPQKPLTLRYIFLAHEAEDLVTAGKFDQAIPPATEALSLHHGYTPALVALGKATAAIQDFARASAAYRELLANRQAAADQIRAFAEQRGTSAMLSRHFAEAARYAAFALELQPNNAGALKLLAEAKLELNDVNAAMEAGQKLEKLYPSTASELAAFSSGVSDVAFQAHDYARAARYAAYSLRLEPAQSRMQLQLAASEFALADFRAAADGYRKLIVNEEDFPAPALLTAFADSLGSTGRPADAAREFQTSVRPNKSFSDDLRARVQIEEAGLLILSGNDGPAGSLTDGHSSFAPEHAARLGWWYYRAGKYDAADKLLAQYLSLRPGDGGLQTALGWVELEQNKAGDAKYRFDSYTNQAGSTSAARAGQAIVRWRTQQQDSAMAVYDDLIREAPEWTNPTWVRALYGPVAAQSIQEMGAEKERRTNARKR